jgi:hypothetical protein
MLVEERPYHQEEEGKHQYISYTEPEEQQTEEERTLQIAQSTAELDLETLPVHRKNRQENFDPRGFNSENATSMQYLSNNQSNSKPKFRAKNVDDQTVPALRLKEPINFQTVGEDIEGGGGIGGSVKPDAEEGLNYKDIHPTLKSKAASIVNQFGEDCVVRVFNSRWQHREQGVRLFIERMPKAFSDASHEPSALLGINTAVMLTLIEVYKDKVQQIINLSFEATEQYINVIKQYPQITINADQGNFERMFCYLLDRLTDIKNFTKCKATYLKFFEVP